MARWLGLMLLLLVAVPVSADEVIRDFVSDITINANGTMVVEERITVVAEGVEIRRGISRDFLTRYEGRLGGETVVAFKVLSVSLDGVPVAWHTEEIADGVRVHMGLRDQLLSRGEHTYALRYRTDRQLGSFEDQDELFWNVTGNGWAFPIERAEAWVTLPAGAAATQLDAYTGGAGQRLEAYEASGEGSARAHFVTTAPLAPKEGLTIVVAWPKGFIHEPTLVERISWLLRDYFPGIREAGVGLLAVLGFYLLVWFRAGRGTAGGPVVPTFKPPPGISPAAARYLMRTAFDHGVFASAVVSLAVQGLLTIKELGDGFSLDPRHGGDSKPSSRGEREVLAELFPTDEPVVLSERGSARVRAARDALGSALEGERITAHILLNYRYWLGGLALSVCALVGAALPFLQDRSWILLLLLPPVGLGAWFYLALRRRAWFQALLVGSFTLWGLAGGAWATSGGMPLYLILLMGLNILFFELLKAPTRAGRKVLDRIEGFRLYLSVAEGEHPGGPKRTPELYERYLPYAMALGVEREWSGRFAEVLESAGAEGTPYRPEWYVGTSDWSASDGMGELSDRLWNGVAQAA